MHMHTLSQDLKCSSLFHLFSPPTELTEYSDLMQKSSVGAVGKLNCTILSCGWPFFIRWTINNDNGTELPLPIVNNPDMLDNLIVLMSEVTINTLGLVNRGNGQTCSIIADTPFEVFTDQDFFYTLESKLWPAQVSCFKCGPLSCFKCAPCPLSCLKCGPLSPVSSVAPSLLFQVCALSPV